MAEVSKGNDNGQSTSLHNARIVSLTNLLTQYTVQIDEFHKLCTTTSVSLMAFVGVLLTAGATIYMNLNKVNEKHFLGTLSFVILILPAIGTLILYILSMSMRKEALYRAYCGKIEEQLNVLTETPYYCFHGQIVQTEMNLFLTNRCGGIFLSIMLVILYFVSFYAAWIWSAYVKLFNYVYLSRVVVGFFIIVDISFSLITVSGLLSNRRAMKRAVATFQSQKLISNKK